MLPIAVHGDDGRRHGKALRNRQRIATRYDGSFAACLVRDPFRLKRITH
jgi:hypothetical protein